MVRTASTEGAVPSPGEAKLPEAPASALKCGRGGKADGPGSGMCACVCHNELQNDSCTAAVFPFGFPSISPIALGLWPTPLSTAILL